MQQSIFPDIEISRVLEETIECSYSTINWYKIIFVTFILIFLVSLINLFLKCLSLFEIFYCFYKYLLFMSYHLPSDAKYEIWCNYCNIFTDIKNVK